MVMTEGALLGGRVRYRQPATGFRTGLEPVLLAASVAARSGERVLEAGTGAGAALLCLLARVSGVQAVGVEIDEALASLAAANAEANGFAQIEIQAGRFESIALQGWFDHAMANPPYYIAGGSRSPVPGRDSAKHGSVVLVDAWIERLGAALRHRGSLSLTVPAGIVPVCLSAMARHHCPCTAIFPFWPKANRSAKLVLLRGVKLARSPMRLMPGLVLHQPDGSFTEAVKAVLAGGSLNLDA